MKDMSQQISGHWHQGRQNVFYSRRSTKSAKTLYRNVFPRPHSWQKTPSFPGKWSSNDDEKEGSRACWISKISNGQGSQGFCRTLNARVLKRWRKNFEFESHFTPLFCRYRFYWWQTWRLDLQGESDKKLLSDSFGKSCLDSLFIYEQSKHYSSTHLSLPLIRFAFWNPLISTFFKITFFARYWMATTGFPLKA